MTDGVMTTGTGDVFGATVHSAGIDGVGNGMVAAAAGRLSDTAVKFGDLYGVRVLAGCEVERMKEAVACLHGVFPDQVVRRVTVIASSGRMMTGFHPGFVLGAHGMAVRACRRIVEQV